MAPLRIPAAKEQVRDAAGRNREPVRDEPVGERRDDRLLCRQAGERQCSHKARLDESEASGCERDQRQEPGAGVREDDERRL